MSLENAPNLATFRTTNAYFAHTEVNNRTG